MLRPAKLSRLAVLLMAASLAAQTLRQLADQRGIRIGAAADPARLGEALYGATLAREFNQLEPENAMKFGPIHPGPSTYNFAPADALVAFAKENKMAVRGHTLVWHQQNPSWLTGGGYAPEQLASILESHITAVVSRYAGQVWAWDVVNEAFNDDGSLRNTIWSNAPGIGRPGTGYVEQAFRWAHAADPNALLFYNDYNGETVNNKSTAIYEMARDFRARGVPIHGVGLQMHLTANPGSLASMEANIRRLTELGLQVQITELDVRLPLDSSGAPSAASLATQAQIYQNITALCLKFPQCTLLQTWGFTDRYSWIPGTFPGQGAGLIFDAAYQPKPAYQAMLAALQTSPPVITAAGLTNAASYTGEAVAPGEIVTLFGATFGPAELAFSQPEGGKFPAQIAGARLLFDGVPAPMLYAKVGQAAAVVPFGVSGKTTTQVEYEYREIRSSAVSVRVQPTLPGVFTMDSSGRGEGAILDAAFRPISSANPARRGEVILLFATGGGLTNPPGDDGQLTPLAPLPMLVAPISLRIGGVDCPIQYAGGAPGLVAGVVQINAQVAAGVPSGSQPVVVTVGGVTSPPGVTVHVQ
jgi:endo-1,4-beta-xylanase